MMQVVSMLDFHYAIIVGIQLNYVLLDPYLVCGKCMVAICNSFLPLAVYGSGRQWSTGAVSPNKCTLV